MNLKKEMVNIAYIIAPEGNEEVLGLIKKAAEGHSASDIISELYQKNYLTGVIKNGNMDVEVNQIGGNRRYTMPFTEYAEQIASGYGFDSYEEMWAAGGRIRGYEKNAPAHHLPVYKIIKRIYGLSEMAEQERLRHEMTEAHKRICRR